MISIEIVVAEKNKNIVLALELAPNSTVKDALQTSQLLVNNPNIFAEVSSDTQKSNQTIFDIESLEGRVGIFGKIVSLNTLLKSGDRIEIYRSLYYDPKDARRKRGNAETKQLKLDIKQAKAKRRAIKRAFRQKKDES